ncbi:MAG: DNA repair exonuclease [Pseudomonadota bacterium]
MAFRFLHTADWQLGKPFAGFSPDLSSSLRDARLAMIDRLAAAARQEGVQHVLVAGDVWDQAMPSDRVLLQPVDRMAAAADLEWWLLPGNHDPAGPESLWQRLAARGLPANIHALVDATPVALADDVMVLPAPWTSKRPGRDTTEIFETMPTPAGVKRIGLAHGGVIGFGSDPDASHPIDPNRAEKSGLSYLALGDWHGTKEAGPRAWYAGTPEPDRFRNNEAGATLLVEEGQEQHPKRLPTKLFSWEMHQITAERGRDPHDLMRGVLDADWPAHQRLLQIDLSGRLPIEERRKLQMIERDLAARMAYLDWRDRGLEIAFSADDTLDDHADPVIAETARRLACDEDREAKAALLLLDDLLSAS